MQEQKPQDVGMLLLYVSMLTVMLALLCMLSLYVHHCVHVGNSVHVSKYVRALTPLTADPRDHTS